MSMSFQYAFRPSLSVEIYANSLSVWDCDAYNGILGDLCVCCARKLVYVFHSALCRQREHNGKGVS
jgi:hypothetical protein